VGGAKRLFTKEKINALLCSPHKYGEEPKRTALKAGEILKLQPPFHNETKKDGQSETSRGGGNRKTQVILEASWARGTGKRGRPRVKKKRTLN